MTPQNFDDQYKKLWSEYTDFQEVTKQRILDLLNKAAKEMGNFFLSKGFLYDKNLDIYYNPKNLVAAKIEVPDYKYLDLLANYNSVRIAVGYKCGRQFLDYERGCLYNYKFEEPQKVFLRFKKYNGNAESTRMKAYLRQNYAQEMLIAERKYKIQKLSS